HVDLGAVAVGAAAAAHLHAVDGDGEVLDGEGGDGLGHAAGRRDDPAPVGVVAEDRGLDQVGAGDLAGHGLGGVLGGGGADHDVHVVAGALGVGDELAGEVRADRAHRLGELLDAQGHAARAGGQQDDGVVGGHAGVGVDAVEGGARRAAQRLLGGGGVDVGVGGEDDEHGRQLRGEHAGALRDPAHDDAGGERDLGRL